MQTSLLPRRVVHRGYCCRTPGPTSPARSKISLCTFGRAHNPDARNAVEEHLSAFTQHDAYDVAMDKARRIIAQAWLVSRLWATGETQGVGAPNAG